MTTDDQKLTEQIEAAFLDEKPWRAAVEAVMRYEGYTDEQIAEADAPIAHTDECADNGYPFGYDCTDEYGVDQHPFHTRSRELDCTYQLFFEESNLAAAVLPILRRAQADAYEEGAQAQADTYGGQIDTGPNPYEAGDRA